MILLRYDTSCKIEQCVGHCRCTAQENGWLQIANPGFGWSYYWLSRIGLGVLDACLKNGKILKEKLIFQNKCFAKIWITDL